MKAGAAKVDITPPAGIDLTGYGARENPSSGIADNLYSRALVLGDDGKKVAFLANDLLGLDEETTRRIRSAARAKTGMAEDNIMISTSHTHSGPAAFYLRGLGRPRPDYIASLEKSAAEAIFLASRNMKDASFGAGRGRVRINVNRRKRTPGGKILLLAHPEGVVDDEVGVIAINGEGNNPIATIINYACHAVVLGPGNLLVSADYPGAVQRFVERERGGTALFMNGCCGDLNPVVHPGGLNDAERLGVLLGEEVLRVSELIRVAPAAGIRTIARKMFLPLQKFPAPERAQEVLEEKRRELEENNKRGSVEGIFKAARDYEWAEDMLKAVRNKKTPRKIAVEIQAFALDDTVLIGLPGEPFCEIGLKIKEKSPFAHTFVSGYTNGLIGYIPTAEAFEQGGYEVEDAPKLFGISSLSPGAGEALVNEALKLARELHGPGFHHVLDEPGGCPPGAEL